MLLMLIYRSLDNIGSSQSLLLPSELNHFRKQRRKSIFLRRSLKMVRPALTQLVTAQGVKLL